jgi:hypothetical protein
MKISLYFEPRNVWIGLFWDSRALDDSCGIRPDGTVWTTAKARDSLRTIHTVLYFCLVPTLVLKVVL